MEQQILLHARSGETIVEPGAGDGTLALQLGPRVEVSRLRWIALDWAPQPDNWPTEWSWRRENLLQYARYTEADGIVGNLILHQFEEGALRNLGGVWNQHARFLVFNEPLRCRRALWLLRAAGLAGIGPISRYDGAVSVRAGFRGEELPTLLGLDPAKWQWRISTTFLGGYRMAASRRDPS